MIRITRVGAAAACALALVAAAGASVASAAAQKPASHLADAVPTIVTLPLFGPPLTIDITSGPGGALASVTVDPAGTFTATKDRPHMVKFVNADGTAKVVVASRGGGQAVSAKAGKLGDIVGPGAWSGDVFNTGTANKVAFTIADNAGAPDITGISTDFPGAVIGTVEHHAFGDHGGDSNSGDNSTTSSVDPANQEQTASVSITFTSADKLQTRDLVIWVHIGSHDGDSSARVTVALTRIRGAKVDAATAIGTHTWNGTLCDGSAASITYTVLADGSVTTVTPTPATADVKSNDHGVVVTFGDHERVFIGVRVSSDTTQMKINVLEAIRCDSPTPSVNTPTSLDTSTSDGNGNGNGDGGHHGRDHGPTGSDTTISGTPPSLPGDHRGRHNGDSTTTSSTTATTTASNG